MSFIFHQKVLFRHCDPAGIVFYPRYFEMLNDCIEAFFATELEYSFGLIHPENSVPTVEITTHFKAPSRLEDQLELELRVVKIGRTSLGFTINALCKGETRFAARSTLVHITQAGRPVEWPDKQRQIIENILKENQP